MYVAAGQRQMSKGIDGMTQPNGGYILVADSVHLLRRQLVKLLSSTGYDAQEAADGAQAIRTMQLDPPNLVLIDLQLTRISGIEVCAWIRDNEATRNVPIVVCTSGQDRKSLEKAIRAGATDVLVRPVTGDKLRARIEKHLDAIA